MTENGRERLRVPTSGGVSLLTVFAVLCLTVFALLSLSTVRADGRLAQASLQAVEDYYAADRRAQEILARLRCGQRPEGVTFSGGGELRADYSVPISDSQELQVSVLLGEAGERDYEILRWQAVPVGEWELDDIPDLWDGELAF